MRDGTLRRSGFKRPAYQPQPAAPLRPVERCGVFAPASNEPIQTPKFVYLRSASYREFVARQPCFACGIAGLSNACHPNSAKYGKGRSVKAGDQFCWPLCVAHGLHQGCHALHDLCLDMTKAERDELEDRYVERMQRLAREHGRKEIE